MTKRQSKVRTHELAEALVDGISRGITLSQICRDHGINRGEIYKWQEDDPALRERIARARVDGFDAIAEECIEIAEDSSNDYIDTENGPRLNAEHVQRSKLRIETRLKLLAKWDPKRYGDKVEHAVTGSDGGPVQNVLRIEYVRPKESP